MAWNRFFPTKSVSLPGFFGPLKIPPKKKKKNVAATLTTEAEAFAESGHCILEIEGNPRKLKNTLR